MNKYRYIPNYKNTRVPDRLTRPKTTSETPLPIATGRPWINARAAISAAPGSMLIRSIANEGIIGARGTENPEARKLKYLGAMVAALTVGLIIAEQADRMAKTTRSADLNPPAITVNLPAQETKPAETINAPAEKPVAAQPINKEWVSSTVEFGKIILERPMPILMYHKISESKAERFRMPMERFEEQLRYLQNNGFQTITASDLLKEPVPKNAVMITFDDIGLTFYERAYPLLKKYAMKATVFVIVGDLRSDGNGFTWKVLKEMEESGLVDVESHTMNHPNMKKCSAEVIKKELAMSKNLLQAILGKKIDFIAWPYGACTPEAVQIAGKLGYLGLVGIDDYLTRKKEMDLSNVGRIEVDGRWDDTKFQWRMDAFKEKGNLENGLASANSKSP